MVVDVLLANVESDGILHFEVKRGGIGRTQIELYKNLGPTPVLVDTISGGRATLPANAMYF